MHLLAGHLELLILRALHWEPTHGHGVAAWIRLVTAEAFTIEEGSLYPALHRLERQDLVTSEWVTSEHGRRARHYQLTAQGRQELRRRAAEWERYAQAVARAMDHGRPRGLWAGGGR
jgi:transcriptional regulator